MTTQKSKLVEEIENRNPLPVQYAQKTYSLDESINELEMLEKEYSRTISPLKVKPTGIRALAQSFAGGKEDDYVWTRASSKELTELVISSMFGKYDVKSDEVKGEIAKREVYVEKEELDKKIESIKGIYSRSRKVYEQLDNKVSEMQLLLTSKYDAVEVYGRRMAEGEKSVDNLIADRTKVIENKDAEATRILSAEIHSLQDNVHLWDRDLARTRQEAKSTEQMLKESLRFLKIAVKEEDAYCSLLNDYTRMATGMKLIVASYENGDMVRAREALGSFANLKAKHHKMKELHEKRVNILYELVQSATSLPYDAGPDATG